MSTTTTQTKINTTNDDGESGGRASAAAAARTTKDNKKKSGIAATPALRDCANCGAPEGSIAGTPVHKACGKCQITFYCSTECQKTHWKTGGHKEHCVKPEDRRVPVGDDGASGSGGAAEPECAICQGPLSESPSKALPCTHVYHIACVNRLRSFDIKQACPLCRADLPPGPKKLYEDAIRLWCQFELRFAQEEVKSFIARPGEIKPWREITNDGDRRQVSELIRMMKEAAEQDYGPAQLELGCIYEFSYGVERSLSTALKWYRKAASQG